MHACMHADKDAFRQRDRETEGQKDRPTPTPTPTPTYTHLIGETKVTDTNGYV